MDLSGQTRSLGNSQVNVSGPLVAARKPRCMLMDLQGHNLLQYNQLMPSKLLGVRSGTLTIHYPVHVCSNALRSSFYSRITRGAMAVNYHEVETSPIHHIEWSTRNSFLRHLLCHLSYDVRALRSHLAAGEGEHAPSTHSRPLLMWPEA